MSGLVGSKRRDHLFEQQPETTPSGRLNWVWLPVKPPMGARHAVGIGERKAAMLHEAAHALNVSRSGICACSANHLSRISGSIA